MYPCTGDTAPLTWDIDNLPVFWMRKKKGNGWAKKLRTQKDLYKKAKNNSILLKIAVRIAA